MTSAPNLFGYLNFREYLKDFLEFYRAQRPAFRFQTLVDEFGFATRSHLLDVLKGRRLSNKYLSAYHRFCNLSSKELEYFNALVNYNQSKSPSQKAKGFALVQSLCPSITTLELEQEAYQYFAKWYHPLVLSLLDLDLSEASPQAIASKSRYPLSAKEVSASLKFLKQSGFVSWSELENRWVYHTKFFKSTKGAQAAALVAFHGHMQKLGALAYEEQFDSQTFSTLTLSMSLETKKEIDAMIVDLRKRILEKVKQDNHAELVLQINLQNFELTRTVKNATHNQGAKL